MQTCEYNYVDMQHNIDYVQQVKCRHNYLAGYINKLYMDKSNKVLLDIENIVCRGRNIPPYKYKLYICRSRIF